MLVSSACYTRRAMSTMISHALVDVKHVDKAALWMHSGRRTSAHTTISTFQNPSLTTNLAAWAKVPL
jgi:hypothetical protein